MRAFAEECKDRDGHVCGGKVDIRATCTEPRVNLLGVTVVSVIPRAGWTRPEFLNRRSGGS